MDANISFVTSTKRGVNQRNQPKTGNGLNATHGTASRGVLTISAASARLSESLDPAAIFSSKGWKTQALLKPDS